MSKCRIKFPLSPELVSAIYLADTLMVDRVTMLLLYHKYGKDLFYIIYMLSGKKLSVPQMNRLESIFKSSSLIYSNLKYDRGLVLENKRDENLYSSLKRIIEGEEIVFEYESEEEQNIEFEATE